MMRDSPLRDDMSLGELRRAIPELNTLFRQLLDAINRRPRIEVQRDGLLQKQSSADIDLISLNTSALMGLLAISTTYSDSSPAGGDPLVTAFTPTDVDVVGTNGLRLLKSGTVLSLDIWPAGATVPGAVSLVAQSYAGLKTFTSGAAVTGTLTVSTVAGSAKILVNGLNITCDQARHVQFQIGAGGTDTFLDSNDVNGLTTLSGTNTTSGTVHVDSGSSGAVQLRTYDWLGGAPVATLEVVPAQVALAKQVLVHCDLVLDAAKKYWVGAAWGKSGTDTIGNVFTGGILTTLGAGAVGAGTVTSVGFSTNVSWLTVTGSPVVGSGTLTANLTTGLAPNQFVATPISGVGVAALRAIVPADLPVATTTALGIVKPDNNTLSISAGVLFAHQPPLLAVNVVNKSANYTVRAIDDVVRCSGPGAIGLTLYGATGSGKILIVKLLTPTTTITINRAGGDVIDGATSVSLTAQWQCITLMDGASGMWDVISRF